MAKKTGVTEISILELTQGEITFAVLGTEPLVYNAMSGKNKQSLLFPPLRKNAAARAATLKHNPLEEFRSSMYYARDKEGPTRLVGRSIWFKAAMGSAALDLPGSSKAQIGRLVYVVGDEVPIYGRPELLMSVVRNSDIKRTPDIRTRAILPEWAAHVTVRFHKPILKEQTIANLFAAAGTMAGVADWRQQKGSNNYGSFRLVDADDETFNRIVETCGRETQDEAIRNPVCYDSETEEMITWFNAEVKRRGFKVPTETNGVPA